MARSIWHQLARRFCFLSTLPSTPVLVLLFLRSAMLAEMIVEKKKAEIEILYSIGLDTIERFVEFKLDQMRFDEQLEQDALDEGENCELES